MIHYQLQCGQKHQFDGWFNDSGSFEAQAKRGLIECPECGRADIERALMAPALGKRGTREKEEAEPAPAVAATPEAPAPDSVAVDLSRMPARLRAELQKLRAEVEKNCAYVGPQFADQARAMHRGEAEATSIYGETTDDEAASLAEEGITVAKIPWMPRADG